MPDKPLFLSAKIWLSVLIICFIGGFLWGFQDEVKLVRQLLWASALKIFQQSAILPTNIETTLAIIVLALNIAVFCAGYLLILYWLSYFALPISNASDRKKLFKRMFSYGISFMGSHGPAIFVKEGKSVARNDELNDTQPGIALIDLYSAIVLEKQVGENNDIFEAESKRQQPKFSLSKRISQIYGFRKKVEVKPMVRAGGPGITFTNRGEKIIGFADLRNQFRKSREITCNTGDGIEVKTNVTTVFTLGKPPEFLKVAKINDSWVVVNIDDKPIPDPKRQNGQRIDKIIAGFSDEIENEDKEEIEAFFRQEILTWRLGDSENHQKIDKESSPFVFDEERVIRAVYSRARDAKAGRLGEWTELAVDVAVEVFRNKIAHENYDELYMPEKPEEYPMRKFKSDFGKAVRNLGLLGYQIVRRRDGQPLEAGQTCKSNELMISVQQIFRRSTVLRERGIKIISASFGDLVADEIIRTRFFENWQAHWQQEAEKTTAEHELQAMRIRNRERAKAQQDMIYSFSQILQSEQHTSEAIAMRLYQALEAAATQPATQRLLPSDTIQMLQSLREWLMPKEQDLENGPDTDFIDVQEELPEDDS